MSEELTYQGRVNGLAALEPAQRELKVRASSIAAAADQEIKELKERLKEAWTSEDTLLGALQLAIIHQRYAADESHVSFHGRLKHLNEISIQTKIRQGNRQVERTQTPANLLTIAEMLEHQHKVYLVWHVPLPGCSAGGAPMGAVAEMRATVQDCIKHHRAVWKTNKAHADATVLEHFITTNAAKPLYEVNQ